MLIELTEREVSVIRAACKLVADNNRDYSKIAGETPARNSAIAELNSIEEKLQEAVLGN